MTTPTVPGKPTYRTFVAERQVADPRATVWDRLVALLDAGVVGPVAEGHAQPGARANDVLSFEPPWRRVARLRFDASPLAEHTIVLRDDGDRCHLVWAYLVEVPAGGADPEFEAGLDRLADTLRRSCERVSEAG